MQLSVGSPTITQPSPTTALSAIALKALAPCEPVSSPARSRRAKSLQPFDSRILQASYMANICPFASHAPLPLMMSPSLTGGIYGGTVSRCEQKTTFGVPQEIMRFHVPSPTSNFSTRLPSPANLPARKSANPPSLPEVESTFSISKNSSKSIIRIIQHTLLHYLQI